MNQFLDEVRAWDGKLGFLDFGDDQTCSRYVKGVYRTLNYYLSEGEFKDLTAALPGELKEFIRGSIGIGRMVL